ncbi:L-aspartate oxidase [Arthrobacter sp. Hiyo8]|nr:L-aspartate oxidase [Arthrobacter sp. Hiyo8]
MANALILAVLDAQDAGKIQVLGHSQATSLIQSEGRVTGVEFLRNGRLESVFGDAVLLATGGAGQLFAQTTNPSVATADGLALAWRAGAELADLEFFQFHPTSMVLSAAGKPAPFGADPLLISEAVRGEGAILVDANGERFMPRYHPTPNWRRATSSPAASPSTLRHLVILTATSSLTPGPWKRTRGKASLRNASPRSAPGPRSRSRLDT